MVNKYICDVCNEIIWDKDYQPTNLGLLANINDVCDLCFHEISEYAKKLKKENENKNE